MSVIDFLNVLVGGAALILAILSIAMCIYFFVQSKNTEKSVAGVLESIKAQTDILQKITDKHIGRLIRHATDKNPINESITNIYTEIQRLSSNLAVLDKRPISDDQIKAFTNEAIGCYIMLFYYIAIANIFIQISLPPIGEFDEKNEFHMLVKNLTDQSSYDTKYIQDVLSRVNESILKENIYHQYYLLTLESYKPLIKDSTETYAAREKD